MTKWITAKYGANERPEKMNNYVRPGMRLALRRYAKAEGVSATDILDTLLMKDRRLVRHLRAVQKGEYDEINNSNGSPATAPDQSAKADEPG